MILEICKNLHNVSNIVCNIKGSYCKSEITMSKLLSMWKVWRKLLD